jgi:hypothetical protein
MPVAEGGFENLWKKYVAMRPNPPNAIVTTTRVGRPP